MYEERGLITGLQVALDGQLFNRIRYAFIQTFEDWMMTIGGEEGVEQDHFLLEDKELVVGGHNFHIRIRTHLVWAGIGDNISLECILGTGELSKHLKGVFRCCWWLSVRLCGGTELDFLFLTFHWD